VPLLLRFILGILALGIAVFFLVFFLSTPKAEKPATPVAAVVQPAQDEPRAAAKAKAKRGEDDDDDTADDNESNDTEESEEDAIQEQRLERRMNR
jgi:cytoskeletal protein RodZ